MKKVKIYLVLALSIVLLAGLAQQKEPSKISYKDVQGNIQRGPVVEWETCPPGSFFSQPPTLSSDGSWGVYASDAAAFSGYMAYDNFTGVTQPIGIVHFWGMSRFNNYGWYDCNSEDPMTFEIVFYQDDAGEPGVVVYSETIPILQDPTGLFYSTYSLNHYKAVLDDAVSMESGWISIRGVSLGSPDNCIFSWMNSAAGDELAYHLQPPDLYIQFDDLSLCFEPGPPPEVPLAPWALVFGAILITGTIFIRYRRIF